MPTFWPACGRCGPGCRNWRNCWMKARDFPALHDAVRDTAVMLWNRGTVEPGQFLMAFNAGHGHAVDSEELRYGYEQYVVSLGLKKFKNIRGEARKMAGSPQ